MTQPTVCAVMLTANRQQLTDRAVRSFLAQDYPARHLVILDTGKVKYKLPSYATWHTPGDITYIRDESPQRSIGALRNAANSAWKSDIFIHFDSDDWSARTRISDQVKLLVESGKQAVGYREMLFWDCRPSTRDGMDALDEAWLYRNTDSRYIVSTSACYWRTSWEAKPFDDVPTGEVGRWIKGIDTLGQQMGITWSDDSWTPFELIQMVATIHGQNTVKKHIFPAATNPDGSLTWTRVSAWDARCRAIIEAA